MEKNQPFSLKARARSFKYAFKGIGTLLREEHNSRIHLAAAILAVAAGLALDISAAEWGVVALCIGSVIAAECFNSAIEALCDKVSPQYDPLIGKAKDVAAAGVLLTAIGAAVAGIVIFGVRIVKFL